MSKSKRGEPKVVAPEVASSDKEQEALAFMKILELGQRNIEEGKTVPVAVAMRRFRARLRQLLKKKR